VGDTVLWSTTDPSASAFAVRVSGERFSFNSQALRAEAIFTHAFGLLGTHEWADPTNPGISGTVEVKSVAPKTDAEKQAWLDSLSKGAAFEIKGGKVSPHKLEIVVGQTVFWKVSDGEGISVVDKRLLGASPKQTNDRY
jgi:plastocyanin